MHPQNQQILPARALILLAKGVHFQQLADRPAFDFLKERDKRAASHQGPAIANL